MTPWHAVEARGLGKDFAAVRALDSLDLDVSEGRWLRLLTYLNPLAYGVDLLKHGLLGSWAGSGYGGEWPVARSRLNQPS